MAPALARGAGAGAAAGRRKVESIALDLGYGSASAFIHISDGKLHDVNVFDMLAFEAGAFYVMDRGYVDFERLYALHQAGEFFVTRAKSPMDARHEYATIFDRPTVTDTHPPLSNDSRSAAPGSLGIGRVGSI